MNGPRQLTLTFSDRNTLYLAYMPFLRNGGLFSCTDMDCDLGAEVLVSLRLMGEDEPFVVAAHVVWITPDGTQGERRAGIGVQFDASDRGETRKRIEDRLAGTLGGDRSTHTM